MNEETKEKESEDKFVQVAVVTTSGTYPKTGFEKTPVHQKVKVILKQAATKLGIADTTDWVATVDDKVIDPESTYLENHLHGKIEIDYGPREGGGGNA